MKRLLLVSALLCTCVLGSAAQSDTLRVLAIGNSFSVDAVNQNLGDLAVAAGKHIIVGNLYIGGCSLERHVKSLNKKLPDYVYYKRTDSGQLVPKKKALITDGIFDEPWDIVTFQQASPKSGQVETFDPYLGVLVDYIKANVPTAGRLMWHQTWAYPQNSVNTVMYKNYGSSERMYEAVCEASSEICRKYNLEIIPVGTAIQNVRSSFDRDNCNRDGSHLSVTMGRYTAACTWFEAIFGESVIGNGYGQKNLPSYRVEVAQNAAHLALARPYGLTDMSKSGFEVPKANTDESEVPSYTLPDPLVMNDGTTVGDKTVWMEKRRAEILSVFAEEVYGKSPAPSDEMYFEVLRTREDALGGKAVCKEVRVHFTKAANAYMDLILYTPKRVRKAPVFLGINFKGNYSISDDEWISRNLNSGNVKRLGILENRERGVSAAEWPLEEIIGAGYGVATFYRGDVAPDYDTAHNLGVFRHMTNGKYPEGSDWGNISAWAWGLSRALDYLETDPDVDSKRVALVGHSRLGKAALWAGAQDTRFAMVISNCSGCLGAALSRRCYGETVEAINKHFPHWFCENFKKYNGRENELPVDQHELLALIAPRPLYVASGSKDSWADPTGEGLALREAEKVYRLFGKPATGRHIHEGPHGISIVDWRHYISFADKYLRK